MSSRSNRNTKILKSLFNSIPSFGKRVSNVFISEIYKDEYACIILKKLTAFFGLEVREDESGSSVWKKARITKFGNPTNISNINPSTNWKTSQIHQWNGEYVGTFVILQIQKTTEQTSPEGDLIAIQAEL